MGLGSDHHANRVGTIGFDVACVQCGYNLRTLAADGQCPECSVSVSSSLRTDRLVFADPVWLKHTTRGLTVTLWSLVFTAVLIVGLDIAVSTWNGPLPGTRTVVYTFDGGSATGTYNLLVDVVPMATKAICVVMVMIGVWMCTRPAPIEKSSTRWNRRWASRLLAVLCVVSVLAPFVLFEQIRFTAHKMDGGVWVGVAMPTLRLVLDAANDVAILLTAPVFLLWLAGLARRIPSAALARWSFRLALLFALVQFIVLVAPVAPVLVSKAFGTAVFDVTAVAFIGMIVGVACLIVLIRRRVRTIISSCVPPATSWTAALASAVDSNDSR